MKRSYDLPLKFLASTIKSGPILRGISALAFSMGTAAGVIYANYLGYWTFTIYRTQTVDFNILANLLPGTASRQLLSNDVKSLQKTLDSNYGLFGIIITDCKSTQISCPAQKITHASKAKIKKINAHKRILVSEDFYAKSWLKKFDNVDSPEAKLGSELFIPLYNPPLNEQAWRFATPREKQIVYLKQKSQGTVIGRIYLLRSQPPLFTEELWQWLQNSLRISGKTLVYNAIAITALITGLAIWLLLEIHYHLKLKREKDLRAYAENISRLNLEKYEVEAALRTAEADLCNAIENELKAVKEASEAENIAQSAELQIAKLEELIKEEACEYDSRLGALIEENEQLSYDKLEFIKKQDQHSEELELIIKQKNEAEDAARKAQEKLKQASVEAHRAQEVLFRQQKLQKSLIPQVTASSKAPKWLLGFSPEFNSQINQLDRKMQGRVLEAISEITKAPMTAKGDTIKPLTGEKHYAGQWRYRIAGLRLVYYPDTSTSTIKLIALKSRDSSY
jgi:mRNA-degrading endonuclease RelE of RelBE toxin-antitoxin system